MTTDGGPAFNLEEALKDLCERHEEIGRLKEQEHNSYRAQVEAGRIYDQILDEFEMLQERAKA